MFNYNKSFLEKTAVESGFQRDNLEKIFRLIDILNFLNASPTTKEFLTLKGGTAINLTVFKLPRLSVDIDLDFSKDCNRDEMTAHREIINENILNFMFSQGYALSPNTKNPHSLDSWVYFYQNAGGNKDNIKIEINYSMRNHILPLIKQKVKTEFLQNEDEYTTLDTLELFGSKIKALIERAAPRDLYDIHNMIKFGIIQPEESDLLRKIVLFYMVVGSKNKISFPISFSSINSISYYNIRTKLAPVLKKGDKFNFEFAKNEVSEYLISLMSLTDNENLFVDNFYTGFYLPELLFEDDNIINRIKEHPMAIWKTRNIKLNK